MNTKTIVLEPAVAATKAGFLFRQTELFGIASTAIDQRVMCWAQNPYHMTLACPSGSPLTIPLMGRSVSNIDHSIFTTTWHFAQSRKSQLFQNAISESVATVTFVSGSVVFAHRARVALLERFERASCGFMLTFSTAIFAVHVLWTGLKNRSAKLARFWYSPVRIRSAFGALLLRTISTDKGAILLGSVGCIEHMITVCADFLHAIYYTFLVDIKHAEYIGNGVPRKLAKALLVEMLRSEARS